MTKNKAEIITTKSGRKLALVYVTQGQRFATFARLLSGRDVIAETEIVPYGFTGAARDRALELAARL